ncbi:Uncharacterised protein [Clostridioides difficile]|nr:Uncharacterised protein [Clostridioides difficile]
MYISHRFPMGGLWWPTSGEDIHVEDLGTLPGKAVLLETKVPELQADETHRTIIDVGQLRRYCASGLPVYYVFPRPPWRGDLLTSGWLGPERRADLAYVRSEGRWFGNWTYVCLARDLLDHLSPGVMQKTATLTSPVALQHWAWRSFWKKMAGCGSPDMPSIFILPPDGPGPRGEATRIQLRDALAAVRRQEVGPDLPTLPSDEISSLSDRGRPRKPGIPAQRLRELRRLDKRFFIPSLALQEGRENYTEVATEQLDGFLRGLSERTATDGADEPQLEALLSVCALSFNYVG